MREEKRERDRVEGRENKIQSGASTEKKKDKESERVRDRGKKKQRERDDCFLNLGNSIEILKSP